MGCVFLRRSGGSLCKTQGIYSKKALILMEICVIEVQNRSFLVDILSIICERNSVRAIIYALSTL